MKQLIETEINRRERRKQNKTKQRIKNKENKNKFRLEIN